MTRQAPFTTREEYLVQFGYELALGGIGHVALKTYEDVMEDFELVPRWRYFKRRRLLREADSVLRLYRIAAEYESQQIRAAAGVHGV